MHGISRRSVLKLAGLAAGSAVLGVPAAARAAGAAAPRPSRTRALRLAHLTDAHVQPERRAGEGLAACLRHVHGLKDTPGLIITGGDHIMDSFAAGEARTKLQWDLWHRTLKDECTIPVESTIGNHDVWGWNKTKSKATGQEALWGKKWATEALRLPGRYRALDRAGWRIIILDSVFPKGEGYIGKIDDEQFEWLEGDLAATPAGTPVLVVSHIPILSAATLFFGDKPERPANTLDPSLMHVDAGRLHRLFLKHRNVKLCLSGHLHLVDRCDFDGVTYLCNGAVSGNWWKGRHQECDEGYAVVDLFDDGSFEREYVTYGWKAQEPAPPKP